MEGVILQSRRFGHSSGFKVSVSPAFSPQDEGLMAE